MPGITDQGPDRHENSLSDRLAQFESEWRTNAPPNLLLYLVLPDCSSTAYLNDLIQLDLEFRWKQYDQIRDRSSLDPHGFKLLPILEDYAELETASRDLILTADLFAAEYRARTKWGDQPAREDYFTRFRGDPDLLAKSLERVEIELNPAYVGGSKETVDYSRGDSQVDRATIRESDLPESLGRYRLLSRLGRGGFGEVWKAYDPELDRHVAIKIPRPDRDFPPEVLANFQKEGQKIARLGTIPGIVAVYDTGRDAGHSYIVSELIEGESLEDRLRKGPISYEETVAIVSAVAEALHRAHRKDLIHRDIKPGNVLLPKDGPPVIADFGLAVTETEQLSERKGVVGTVAYMPPEQALGHNHLANAQADIYSLGVVLYRMLTGRLPFRAETYLEWRDQIVNRPPRPPRTIDEKIPEKLEQACLRCLEKRPEDRYRTANDLASELRRALVKSTSRGFIVLVATGAFLVLLGAVIAVSLPPRERDQSPASKKNDTSEPPALRKNLLSLPPTEVIWDPGYPANSYGDPVRTKRFAVNTVGDAVFSFQPNHSSHFQYRMVFLLQERCRRFGLLWGHGNKEKQKAKPVEQANVIYVESEGDSFSLSVATMTFTPTRSIRKGTHTSISKTFEWSREVEIMLTVQDHRITSLRVQGEEIEEIRSAKRVFQEGGLGVYFSKGYFVVTQAWYHNLETKNGKKKET